jgi:hypothetical protein
MLRHPLPNATVKSALRLFACLVLAGWAGPSQAGQPESAYTDLVGAKCKWDAVGTAPGEAEEQTKRCPGLGGAIVVINPWHSYNFIGFAWPKHKPVRKVVRGSALGLKLEWRGERSAKGFDPYAAIIRVMFRKDDDRIERQVLAVMQLRPGEACSVGFIDMTANAKPYELARGTADRLARAFVCAATSPRLSGLRPAGRRSCSSRSRSPNKAATWLLPVALRVLSLVVVLLAGVLVLHGAAAAAGLAGGALAVGGIVAAHLALAHSSLLCRNA